MVLERNKYINISEIKRVEDETVVETMVKNKTYALIFLK